MLRKRSECYGNTSEVRQTIDIIDNTLLLTEKSHKAVRKFVAKMETWAIS
jgi:hypothetical protein